MGWFRRALPLRRRLLVLCWIALCSERAWASEREASLSYHDPSLQPLVARLQSELTSDGYVVRVELTATAPTCEAVASRSAPSSSRNEEQVWIRVDHGPGEPSTGCAAITYFGAGSEARHTRVTAPISDPKRFAILVAEALNGLSTRPLPAGVSSRQAAPALAPRAQRTGQRAEIGAWAELLLDPTHAQPLFGVGLLGELPLSERLALHIDSFGTVTPLQLKEADTSVSARFAWTRVSLALQILAEPATLKLTAGAGPALSWARADVPPPDVARADVGASALLSVGSIFTYPSNQPVQLGMAFGISALLPSVRLELPSGPSAPFGRLLGEAGIGLVVDL